MVKKVIDIIPPQNWPAVPLPKLPALAACTEDERPSVDLATEPFMKEAGETVLLKRSHGGEVARGHAAREGNSGSGKIKGLFWKIGIAAAAILLAMYGLDVKFARAVVKIWPVTSELPQQAIKISVDPSIGEINLEKNAIPGFAISVENTVNGDAPVTGKKDAQGKAAGTVKLFNNFTKAQRLIKGTRLQAPLEKFQPALAGDETPWFKTAEDVVLNPKSSATVKVVADIAGEKYNIEPSVFSVPGLVGTAQYTFVYGQSFEKFSGGSLNSVPEVKKEDLENAKIAIENSAKDEIKKQLEAKVREQGLEIVDASAEKFEFSAPVITAKAGDNIAKIGGQISAKASTVAYKKSDLENLSRRIAAGKVASGYIIDEKSWTFESSYAGIDTASGRPARAVAVRATIYAGLSESDLKKGMSEKKKDEALLFLTGLKDSQGNGAVKEVKIQLTPPWRFAIPRDLDRIEVQTIFE
jgi:hypothetical protein